VELDEFSAGEALAELGIDDRGESERSVIPIASTGLRNRPVQLKLKAMYGPKMVRNKCL